MVNGAVHLGIETRSAFRFAHLSDLYQAVMDRFHRAIEPISIMVSEFIAQSEDRWVASEASEMVRERIECARVIRHTSIEGQRGLATNSRISPHPTN